MARIEENRASIFLETERLLLREFTADEAYLLRDLDADPEVRRYLDLPNAPSLGDAQRNLARYRDWYARFPDRFGHWAALEKTETPAFIGWFHLRPSQENPDEIALGYRLKRARWGQGYATEGSRALIHKSFKELGVERIVATALAENRASRHVMEKVGLHHVEDFLYRDVLPAVKYALYRSEYQPLPQRKEIGTR